MTADEDAKPSKFVPWDKERVIRLYQKFILKGNPCEGKVADSNWLKALNEYSRIRGFLVAEQEEKEDAVLVIPQAESTALWEELLQQEQDKALADIEARLSTDPGTTVPSGGQPS